MAISCYINLNNLLVLSYYDRLIDLDRNGHYQIYGDHDHKRSAFQLINLIKSLKCNPQCGPNRYFLVRLEPYDIEILHNWGFGLDLNGQQLYRSVKSTKYLFFGNSMNSQRGGAKLSYERSNTFSSTMKTTLKFLIKGLKITAGIGAVVASGGAGGDTIVGAISATIDSGMFAERLFNVINSESQSNVYLGDLLKIKFYDGPESVRQQTITIIERIVADGQIDQLDLICPTLNDLLDSIANVVGDWISTFIPDSGGLVGSIIESVISSNGDDSYNILATFFNKMPSQAQDLLKNILKFLEDALTGDNQEPTSSGMASKFLKTSVTMAIPGGALIQKSGLDKQMYQEIFNFIRTYFEPNIDKATAVVAIVMPLVFVILTLGEYCKNRSKLETLQSPNRLATGLIRGQLTSNVRGRATRNNQPAEVDSQPEEVDSLPAEVDSLPAEVDSRATPRQLEHSSINSQHQIDQVSQQLESQEQQIQQLQTQLQKIQSSKNQLPLEQTPRMVQVLGAPPFLLPVEDHSYEEGFSYKISQYIDYLKSLFIGNV
jgi:hypothetical protein